MDIQEITKQAKFLNIVEIAMTIIIYVIFRILNSSARSITTDEALAPLIIFQSICCFLMGLVSVVVIIRTCILMKKNQKRVKGLGLLLAAGILTLGFSIIQVSIGLIIWILCAASMKQLKQSVAETEFASNLSTELNKPKISDADMTDNDTTMM